MLPLLLELLKEEVHCWRYSVNNRSVTFCSSCSIMEEQQKVVKLLQILAVLF